MRVTPAGCSGELGVVYEREIKDDSSDYYQKILLGMGRLRIMPNFGFILHSKSWHFDIKFRKLGPGRPGM